MPSRRGGTVLFQGTGTRWVGELAKTDHSFRKLFEAVKDKVAGVSCGCVEAFGANESAQQAGFEFVRDNKVPGTSDPPSVHKLANKGYIVLNY